MKTDSNIQMPAVSGESQPAKMSHEEKVRRLLGRPPPSEFQVEWTRFYAAEKKLAPPVTESLVIFCLGNEWLALATNVFQEISERTPIHTLPHRRKDVVLGLVRVRGELLVCVSVAAVLGIAVEPSIARQKRMDRFIVLNSGGNRFGFPVDEVCGIHRLSEELSPVPATVARSAANYTRGLFSWNGKTVGCLDHQLLFHTLNRSLT